MAAPALPVAEPLPGAPAEPNPFSFREFVRSKARGGGGAGADTQAAWAVPPLPAVPAESGDEQEDEEEEWSESYRPLAVEQEHLGSAGAAPEPGWVPPLQPSYEQLKEENAILRSKINKLQILSETQADKMRKLEKKLEENKIKEEKEAQDLEAMVQHVEQNLQLMTKRAAKAENSAAKLRQENAQLQPISCCRNAPLEPLPRFRGCFSLIPPLGPGGAEEFPAGEGGAAGGPGGIGRGQAERGGGAAAAAAGDSQLPGIHQAAAVWSRIPAARG
ncbi:endosome-associated-trafficking regulator 1 isoform X3 [Camarhynchus parvulus]|uniref:endosome-associated-trafficking regulator 1 isoform X3 n=1 Tax=Geospiza parvula TaxID=87175 RepID=UPI001237BBCB|nr:endosome-associated-trafficking regulator 1 isoform X3 [Camarhynchus parvulus]